MRMRPDVVVELAVGPQDRRQARRGREQRELGQVQMDAEGRPRVLELVSPPLEHFGVLHHALLMRSAPGGRERCADCVNFNLH